MALDNSQKMDIIKDAILNGYKGSFEELYMQADPESVEVAETPEQQEQGLRGREAEEMPDAMVFPEASGDFNTMGMKAPINIDKVNQDGDLVQSYRNVPPGVGNLPMGDDVGTVIETPAKYDDGGFYKVSDIIEYQKGGYRDSVEVFKEQYDKDLFNYYQKEVEEPEKWPEGKALAGKPRLAGDYMEEYNKWKYDSESGTLRSMDRVFQQQELRKEYGDDVEKKTNYSVKPLSKKQKASKDKMIAAFNKLSPEDQKYLTTFANKTAEKFIDKGMAGKAIQLAKLDLSSLTPYRKKMGLTREEIIALTEVADNASFKNKATAAYVNSVLKKKKFKKGGYKKKYLK